MDVKGYIALICLALLLGFLLRGWIDGDIDRLLDKYLGSDTTETRVDSVLTVRIPEPITITDTVVKVREVIKRAVLRDTVVKHDTTIITRTPEGVYCAPPFVAFVDTVVKQGRIEARYEYPQMTMSVMFQQKPDSVYVQRITQVITQTESQQRPWWMDILTHVGAASLGYLASNATNNN